MRAAHRHLGGRGRDEDPREVPACAGERGVGSAPRPDVRQELPAHVRGGAGPRRQAAGRGVQAPPRAAVGRRAAADPPPGAGREPRRRRRDRRPARGRAVLVVVVGIVTALYFARQRRRRAAAATTTRRSRRRRRRPRRRRSARSTTADDVLGARGRAPSPRRPPPARPPAARADRCPSYVCLDAPAARRVVNGRILQAGPAPADLPLEALPADARQRRGAAAGQRQARGRSRRRGGILGYEITPPGRVRPLPAGERPDLRRMSARAGIVVTGTEVLTGRVSDRNGPWLSDRLRELGVDHRATPSSSATGPRTWRARSRSCASIGVDLIVTSGGLGPTADDLTAEVVGAFQGRAMVLDDALEARSARSSTATRALAGPRSGGGPRLQPQAGDRARGRRRSSIRSGPRPASSSRRRRRTAVRPSSCCPGRRASCRRCGARRSRPTRSRRRSPARRRIGSDTLRLFGIPESEIAETLRVAEADGLGPRRRSRSRRACAAGSSRW